ncbi:MAG: hypothetical protein L0Z50_00620 [Verrucomicrobiales bacterium]|nr:hypothetical protein [Verrucomicrobiales bacterium]
MLDDCIFASNGRHTQANTGGSISAYICSVFEPSDLGIIPLFPLVVADPQFVDAARGNYALKDSSRVRDKGRSGSGALDPDGTQADLGAYGGPEAASLWPYPSNGPVVRNLTVGQSVVQRGEKIKINASATTR